MQSPHWPPYNNSCVLTKYYVAFGELAVRTSRTTSPGEQRIKSSEYTQKAGLAPWLHVIIELPVCLAA